MPVRSLREALPIDYHSTPQSFLMQQHEDDLFPGRKEKKELSRFTLKFMLNVKLHLKALILLDSIK